MGSDDTTTLKNDLAVVKDLGTFVACSDVGAWALHQYLAELLHTYRGGRDNLFKFKATEAGAQDPVDLALKIVDVYFSKITHNKTQTLEMASEMQTLTAQTGAEERHIRAAGRNLDLMLANVLRDTTEHGLVAPRVRGNGKEFTNELESLKSDDVNHLGVVDPYVRLNNIMNELPPLEITMGQPFMVLCREIDGNYNYRAEFYVHTLIRKASQLARAYYTSTTNAEGGSASAQRRAENINREVIRSERQVILAALKHLNSNTYKERHSAKNKHSADDEGQMKDVYKRMLENPSWGYDKFQDLLRDKPEASKWFKTLSTRTRAMSTGDREPPKRPERAPIAATAKAEAGTKRGRANSAEPVAKDTPGKDPRPPKKPKKSAGDNGGKKDMSKVRCFSCNEMGHYKSNCPKRSSE